MKEDCSKLWGRSMRTDEQQCLLMKTADSRSDIDDIKRNARLLSVWREQTSCSLTAL